MARFAKLPASFYRLAWSNLAAQSAEQLAAAAAPIVTVLALGGDVGATGLVQAAQTLPFVLFAIPAGLLTDRLPRRTIMACAEALRVLSLIAICALVASQLLTWPLLALLALIGACGTVAYSVAAPALVPALVDRAALAHANSRVELARTVAFTAGPAVGGTLIGASGALPAFASAAGLSLIAVFLLGGIGEPPRPARARRHALQEIAEGARFVFQHPLLRPVFVTQFIFNTAFFMLLAVFVPHAVRSLGLSASGIGMVLGTYGVGMVIGALLAGQVMRLFAFGVVIGIGPLSGLAGAIAMAMTASISSPLLAALGFFLLGSGPILWVISTTTLRQTVTPPTLLGRVSAINIMAYGARPLGAGLGALIGAWYGADVCLIVAAVGFVAQAAIIFASPVVKLAQQPAATPG